MPANYLSFFNLNDDPFRLTPDTSYFYNSAVHATALQSLEYCVQQKEGFCLLTGGPGTGKTTIQRIFTERWQERAEIALIMTPRLLPDEFFQAILDDFRIPLNPSKNEMLKSFRDFLLSHAQRDKRVAIVVDEAQELPESTLEELRLLSNLETEKEKLLQIILIGQCELSEKLAKAPLRQLNQRITVRVGLQPLSAPETSDYISTRLIRGGNSSLLFNQKAKDLIFKLSQGVPRTINLLASRGLMSAYLEESHEVFEKHIEQGARDVMEVASPTGAMPLRLGKAAAFATAGVLFCGAIGAGLYLTRCAPDASSPGVGNPATRKSSAASAATAATASETRTATPGGTAPKGTENRAAKSAPAEISFAAAVSKEISQADPHQTIFQAFNVLAAAWRSPQIPQFVKAKGSPEGYLASLSLQSGMELINFEGNPEGVLELGYPLILRIKPSDNDREIYAALSGVSRGEYLIPSGLAGKKRLTRQELESVWRGKAMILWKNYEKIPPRIPRGDRTPVTLALQKLLSDAGIALEKNGIFDRKTADALKSFQELKGVGATGRPGPKTLLYLYQGSAGYFHPTLKL
jgi:general secretion pathway protein A